MGDAADDEEHDADRRREHADDEVEHEDEAEVQRVNAVLKRDWVQERHEHDVGRVRLQEHADDEQDHRHHSHENKWVGGHRPQKNRQLLWQQVDCHQVSDDRREGDQRADHRGCDSSTDDNARQVSQREFARDQEADRQRINDSDRCTFGGREGAANDAADHDHRHQQNNQ
ncbi:hypothetical protein D9M68_828160 [compost metagenome]